MNKNKEYVCENITSIKTKLLIIGSETKNLSEDLKKALINFNLYNNIEIKYSSGKKIKNIKNNDLYIIKIDNITYEKTLSIIKKIYQSNSKACLFLVYENNLDKKIHSFLDSTDLGEIIQGYIDPNNKDFTKIINYLSSIENTKNKLNYLWNKLEQVDD